MADVNSKVKQDSHDLEILPCVFFSDVFRTFRKDSRVTVLVRCSTCREYLRFEREMDEEEERFWVFEQAVRANPEAYMRGELR